MSVHRTRWLPLLAFLWLFGCSDEDGPAGGNGAVMFRFGIRQDDVGTEDFIAMTSDPEVIERSRAQLKLALEERTLHIHGPIARGDGGHNLSWGWHFVPGEWKLVEISMELCDGNPSAVEADIDTWVDAIGVFCPWNSYVKEEIP